ncbi:MAG: hypothetical protein C4293_03960 [Nitrospiraceae bacterium]
MHNAIAPILAEIIFLLKRSLQLIVAAALLTAALVLAVRFVATGLPLLAQVVNRFWQHVAVSTLSAQLSTH